MFSFGSLYGNWLYLVIVSMLTPDSIGILGLVYVAFIFSVHGTSHLISITKAPGAFRVALFYQSWL